MAKREVRITHPDKRYFPSGFRKVDMIEYYGAIAPLMLPHLRNRPVTLIRFPEGVTGEKFYEKNAPRHAPPWIETFPVPRHHHEGFINYILVNHVETLAWCANLGAIEFHPFLHRAPKVMQPTHLAFDLDPGEGADVLACIAVAQLLRELLGRLGLEAYPKVSGSKGLQLYVPLNTPVTYAVTSPFAKTVAEHLGQQHPKLVVSNMAKVLRKGRVLIDWSQNSEAKTTVCVYSLRGKRDEPFVSVPVTWAELERAARKKDPAALFFTPAQVLARVKKVGDLFAPVLVQKQKLPAEFIAAAGGVTGEGTRPTGGGAMGGGARPTGRDGAFGTRAAKGKVKARPARTSAKTVGGVPSPRSGATGATAATARGRKAAPQRSPRGALARYAAKRDFSKTAEPRPVTPARATDGAERRFVIQKHAASHLHFDFRLEMGGTLKSWAVPKGLPYELGVKRSAFQVEDHPIDYLDFEGTIPQGQYGGGTVMVWDIGTYELLGGNYGKGDLKLRLHGRKLKGEWHIFRIRSDDAKPVWLIGKSGEPMPPLSARQEDASVLTRRSMARIAEDNDRQWQSR